MQGQSTEQEKAGELWHGQLTAREARERGLVEACSAVLAVAHSIRGSVYDARNGQIPFTPESLRTGDLGYISRKSRFSDISEEVMNEVVAYSLGGKLEGEDFHWGGVDFIAVNLYRKAR